MADFLDIEIETDAQTLADNALDYLSAQWEEWEPNEGNLEVVLIEAISPMAQDAAETAAQVPSSIFRKYGTDLIGVPYKVGLPATANTTWVLSDTSGHLIPGGTQIAIGGYAFATDADVVVPEGQSSAVNVPVTATDEGSDANGLSAPVDLISALDWVTMITVNGVTGHGADAEDDADYQDRLARELKRMAPRPITADDYAAMAEDTPNVIVGRATAIDGYNPADDTYNNGRYMAVFATAADGTALSSADKTAIQNFLEAYREVNFVVTVNDPTYTTVDVVFDVTAYPNYNKDALNASVVSAVSNFLSPQTWGQPSDGYGDSPPGWSNETVVRYNKMIGVIEAVPGVNYLNTLTINGTTADVPLNGAAPLPLVGTVSGAVS